MPQGIELTDTNRSDAYPKMLVEHYRCCLLVRSFEAKRKSSESIALQLICVFGFEGTGLAKSIVLEYNTSRYLAWWLSWLERRPVTAEVMGPSPIRVVSTEYRLM